MWAAVIVILAVIAIIGVGIGLFVRTMNKTRWLKQHGTPIIAKVTDSIFAAGGGTATAGCQKLELNSWSIYLT